MTAVLYPGGWFPTLPVDWGNCSSGSSFIKQVFGPSAPLTNIITIIGAVVSGADAAFFNADPTGDNYPAVVSAANTPGLPVRFSPNANRVFNAIITFSYKIGSGPTVFSTQRAVTGTGIVAGTAAVGFNIPGLVFPPIQIGIGESFTSFRLTNNSNVAITVNSLAFTTGVQFTLASLPGFPFGLAVGASSAQFTVTFTPTQAIGYADTLTATLSTAGTGIALFSGSGLPITPMFNLNGTVRTALFGVAGFIQAFNPLNLDTEEPASFVKLHEFQSPNMEKQLMRIRGHYQDFGPSVFTFTAVTKRIGQPVTTISDVVNLGTVAADGWVREFTADLDITGELIQLTCSRAANSGPTSILDYVPCLEPKGEVIEGT